MLRDWTLFFEQDDELRKTILRQHQTRAAIKVAERCADPAKRSGLVWHTQGSGKTFTMVTAARLMLENPQRFAGATVLLVVDRNELEGQLSGWGEALLGDFQGSGVAVELRQRGHAYRHIAPAHGAMGHHAKGEAHPDPGSAHDSQVGLLLTGRPRHVQSRIARQARGLPGLRNCP